MPSWCHSPLQALPIRAAVALLAALIGILGLAACATEKEEGLLAAIHQGSVTVGTKFDQPGLSLRDPDGLMRGFDVEIASWVVAHIAQDNQWPTPEITWVETPSSQRELALKEERVHLVAASYSMTPRRADAVDFAGPYLITEPALLLPLSHPADQGAGSPEIPDSVCAVSGATTAAHLSAVRPEVNVVEYPAYADCIKALRTGAVGAVISDAAILSGYQAQQPGRWRVYPMSALSATREAERRPDYQQRYGIGLAPGDADSVRAVDAALSELVSSGLWQRLADKHFSAESGVRPGVPGGGDQAEPAG